jgi:hypothetical protein
VSALRVFIVLWIILLPRITLGAEGQWLEIYDIGWQRRIGIPTIDNGLALVSSGINGLHDLTKTNRMDVGWIKYIGPFSMTPNNNFTLVFLSFYRFITSNRNGSQEQRAVWGKNGIWSVDFIVWSSEVLIKGDIAREEMHGCPSLKRIRACSSPIVKFGLEQIESTVPGRGFSAGHNLPPGKGNYGAELGARVYLGFVGDSILLIDKPIRDGGNYNQEGRKDRYGERPPSYVAVGLGLVTLGA